MSKPMQGKGGVAKKGTFPRLMKYITVRYKLHLTVVLVCIFLNAVAGVIGNMLMQQLIDKCITPGLSVGFDAVVRPLIGIISAMAISYSVGLFGAFMYTRIMAKVTQDTLHNLRTDMFNKMQTLPIKYYDTHAHGDIMSTYTNDVDAVRQVISQSMPVVAQSLISILAMFVMMLTYSIWMTLVVIACLIIMAFASKKVGGASSKYMLAQQKSLAKEEGFVEEMINGQKVVKVFCHEPESKADFDRHNEELFDVSSKAHKFGNILMPIIGNMGNIMFIIIAVVGGLMVHYDAMNVSFRGLAPITIGILITFMGMFRQLIHTMGNLSNHVPFIAMALAGASRIFDLMDEKPEEDNGYVTLVNAVRNEDGSLSECEEKTGLWAWKHPHKELGTITYEELKGDITLLDVDFGYVPDKEILHDVSIYAKPGQKIALVGATGAGKTTITNLLNRFYDIPDGKIRYDGINITKIKKPDLRRSLGVVLQDVNLFTGTVMENIRYGRLDATDEECIEAAKLANAHDFIERLPEGYQTMLINNGANLSQGQRQLLSIARSAVADAPVMILDEATSSIDTRTEALVQKGMDNLMHGRTVFVIAHRLSTIRNSDAIMVLDHGKIIERGNHEQLLEEKGVYYQLYTGAFEME